MTTKIRILFSILTVLCRSCDSRNDNEPGLAKPVVVNDQQPILAVEKTQCDVGNHFDCANCTTRIVCNTNYQAIRTMECTGKTPYCNQGSCVTTRPQNCNLGKSRLCPGVGLFPSPVSCNRFGYCDTNGIRTEQICPGQLVFDPNSGGCNRRTSGSDCPSISCAYHPYTFIEYPPKKQLYFYCDPTGVMLMSCRNNEEFNPKIIDCEFACSANGRFENPRDETLFFLCVESGTGFSKYSQACSPGLIFDKFQGACTVKQ